MSRGSGRIFEGFPPAGAEGACARILVLGSFPSVRSQEKHEYYGHERNQFWPMLFSFAGRGEVSAVAGSDAAPVHSPGVMGYSEKIRLASELGIMIWDMVRSCRRSNSADSELEVVALNDVPALLESHPSIERIGLNGGLSATLFLREMTRSGEDWRAAQVARVF